jgi:hypothetical protein
MMREALTALPKARVCKAQRSVLISSQELNENTSKSSRQNIQHGSHTKRIGHFETSGTSGASATSRHGAHRNIAQTETSGTSDSSAHRANRPHRDIETSGTSGTSAHQAASAHRRIKTPDA